MRFVIHNKYIKGMNKNTNVSKIFANIILAIECTQAFPLSVYKAVYVLLFAKFHCTYNQLKHLFKDSRWECFTLALDDYLIN